MPTTDKGPNTAPTERLLHTLNSLPPLTPACSEQRDTAWWHSGLLSLPGSLRPLPFHCLPDSLGPASLASFSSSDSLRPLPFQDPCTCCYLCLNHHAPLHTHLSLPFSISLSLSDGRFLMALSIYVALTLFIFFIVCVMGYEYTWSILSITLGGWGHVCLFPTIN